VREGVASHASSHSSTRAVPLFMPEASVPTAPFSAPLCLCGFLETAFRARSREGRGGESAFDPIAIRSA